MLPLDQHNSRRRSVPFAANVLQRQANEFIVARLDSAKVESLENDDLL
jgi:hypothetical protein